MREIEHKADAASQDQEMLDLLCDLIIVTARLAKKVIRAMRQKQTLEGGNINVKAQRNGNGCNRASQNGGNY